MVRAVEVRPGMGRVRAVPAALLALLLTAALMLPAGAAAAGPRPILPDYFGVQDDHQRNAAPEWAAARIWAPWCSVQPTAGTDPVREAQKVLGHAFAVSAAAGRTRVNVSLGHPPAWVYGNHPQATRGGNPSVWYCGAARSVTAFPLARTLSTPGPVRAAYAAYVVGVITAATAYLEANSGTRLVLQAWNEPNLSNGGKVNHKIPGAARTWTQASDSLRAQERLMRQVAQRMIPGRFEVSSPAMYGKSTKLGAKYFRAQAKQRTVDSFSLNFYTLGVKSVNSSLSQWRSKAERAKRVVTRYKSLRSVPIWITETNHSLMNKRGNTRNLSPTWTSAAAQKRMVEVTTLEALRMGFAGIEWYQGTPTQTALDPRPGSPATAAVVALRAELVGRTLKKCSTRKKAVTCVFSARPGGGPIKVRWSRKGSAGVTFAA